MRLLRRLAVVVLAVAAVALPAAETVTVKVGVGTANVRFGPSKQAKTALALRLDDEVEVLGRVTKDDGTWYQIRFPKQGKAWMHVKTLKELGENKYEVTTDKARVRDDATAGANIVSELAKGDVVEFRGNRVGDWLAVYPATAVAYVHESVLAVPRIDTPEAKPMQRAIDRLWTTARGTYQQYASTKDLKSALTLDWVGLSAQLSQVSKEHPELSVRLEATRLRNGVEAVVKEQRRQGAHATVSVPQPPADPVVAEPAPIEPKPTDTTPADPVAELPAPVNNTGTGPAPVASPEIQQVIEVSRPVSSYAAEGFLEQRGDLFVVIDATNKVVAVLQAKPGATLQLTDYYWRLIGVKGSSPGMGKDDQGNEVPIVLVDDVELLKQ